MPTSQQDWGLQLGNHKIGEHLYDCNSERNLLGEWLPLLNLEQMWVYNQVVDSVEDQAGCVFFLNGPGGTGKTFVYKTVCVTIHLMLTIPGQTPLFLSKPSMSL